MGLNYPPILGQILICDFRQNKPPEMTKMQLVIVLNKRLPDRSFLCNVVPLSTTPPKSGINYQCRLILPAEIQGFPGLAKWAKADMITPVAYSRLSLPYSRTAPFGKRVYQKLIVDAAQLMMVRRAILHAFHLEILTGALEGLS